jgi:trehalose 6-phosphate phosphatase
MPPAINWKAATKILEPVASAARFGLVTDLDGTLAPVVVNPEEASPTPRNRELLRDLSQLLPLVALLSGRSASDLVERVGLPRLIYVGNHGLDRWEGGALVAVAGVEEFKPALKTAFTQLERLIEPGFILEDKGASLSAHYRRHADPIGFANRIRPKIQQLTDGLGLNLSEGRMVFEIRPPIEVDKGSALRDLVKQAALESAVFLGDDVTDIAALQMARALRLAGECAAWGIAIQSDEAPLEVAATADFTCSGVADVESFLEWLLSIRSASST